MYLNMKNVLRLFLIAALVIIGAKVLSTDFDQKMNSKEQIAITSNN